ncbi:hypothetical protein ABZP36_003471 [Zizania latifolia]
MVLRVVKSRSCPYVLAGTLTVRPICPRQDRVARRRLEKFPGVSRWSAIATHLPKRTDNEIKNYWNTHLKKRLAKMGIDPVTHKPRSDVPGAGGGGGGDVAGAQHAKATAHLSHTAQWESARLEAEARLAREAKLRALAASASHTLPGTAAPGLDSPTSTLIFSESVALASVLEAHAYDEACKEQHWGDVDAADVGFAGAGFTGLLLDGSFNQILMQVARDTEADGVFEETEEDKNYWNGILNLVNSSSASMETTVVVPASDTYSPAPDF